MIFLVLGTQKFQLNRLLMKIDELISFGTLKEKVFAQIGNSDYKPQHYEYTEFLQKEQFEDMIEKCDILVTHSGVGTIITGLNDRKPIIVFPRLAKFGEHVDDHQFDIAESFSKSNYVLLCNENCDLGEILEECRKHKFSQYTTQRKRMVSTIQDYLKSI